MNKKNVTLLALAVLTLTACGSTAAPASSETGSAVASSSDAASIVAASKYFTNERAYFDTSEENPANISIILNTSEEATEVSVSRTKAEANEFVTRNGILTLTGSFLKRITSGEKTMKVVLPSKTVSVSLFAANKVIKTAQEFQDINLNLTGSYILGNDIDLSSIPNFEPLGYYFSETDTNNQYFHGILDGNGYTVKNANVCWSDTPATNYGVFSGTGTTKFASDAHKNGDNVGLFQIIGSSGEVRNVKFSNIKVRGRTIVGVIAGNLAGNVHDCYIDETCRVEMGTHYYDDDCNMGGAFGIVGGSGIAKNIICRCTTQVLGATGAVTVNGVAIEKAGIYLDWSNDYVGKTGNGWDHGTPATNDNPWWKQCGVDKVTASKTVIKDSNGSASNGQYAFVGKCWGSVSDCVAQTFKITPMDGTARDIFFGQTHLAANKPTSGDSNMGSLSNDLLLSEDKMKVAATYATFNATSWSIEEGKIPSVIGRYVLR